MHHAEQVAQIKTMLARLDSGITVDAGGFRRNPSWVYTDPELAEREQEVFFAGHPQLVGLSCDLPGPGTFLTTFDLKTAILATRSQDGKFRAFVNSCRHRGAILEERERGSERRFSCPFHQWTYADDGALVALPKEEHFGDVDRSCNGLIQLPSVERDGLLWVHPDPAGSIDLEEQLGTDLCAELASWNLGELVYLGQDRYEVACNWKLAMDTFGETYHFPVLHRDTLNHHFHGNVQCYDRFGRNHRMLLCRREIDEMRHLPEDDWDITVATLPVYWLFPNIQLMPFEAGVYLVRAYPDPEQPGAHCSRIDFYLRPGPAANAEAADLFAMVGTRFGEIIRDEDYAVSASQQRSADSGTLPSLLFGRNEPALHHYHNTYRSMLGMDPLPLLDSAG